MHEKKTTPPRIENGRLMSEAQDPWKTAPKDRLAHMNRKDRRALAAQARKAQSKADAKKREEAAAEKRFAKDIEKINARIVAEVDAASAELRLAGRK